MASEERFARLEAELAYLRAIVDGGEAQAREAVVVVVGLLASFAAKSGALDYDRLIAFLAEETDPRPDADDRTGMLIHGIRMILAYHRDLESGSGEPAVPILEQLGADEARAMLRRAAATLDFEREVHASDREGIPAKRRSPPDGSRH